MMNRRRLVVAGASILSVPTANAQTSPTTRSPVDIASAACIGRRFLRQHPQWSCIRRLRSIVMDRCIAQGETIAGSICQDFASGNMVIVEGWVLSLTEACVCALIALGEVPAHIESGNATTT